MQSFMLKFLQHCGSFTGFILFTEKYVFTYPQVLTNRLNKMTDGMHQVLKQEYNIMVSN